MCRRSLTRAKQPNFSGAVSSWCPGRPGSCLAADRSSFTSPLLPRTCDKCHDTALRASTVIPTSWRGEAGLGRLASRLPPRAGAAACVQSPGNCRNRCDGRPAEGTPSDSLRDRHLADLGCGVDPGLLHADGSLKTSSAYCPARAAVSRCVLCASPGRIGAEKPALGGLLPAYRLGSALQCPYSPAFLPASREHVERRTGHQMATVGRG